MRSPDGSADLYQLLAGLAVACRHGFEVENALELAEKTMEEYGTVASVKVITDRETRRSKGFAFIEMPDDAEANNAIKQLNGAEYVGRSMVVKEALPKN